MPSRRPPADVLLARHWLTHPGEPAYKAARHIGIEPRTAQKAAERLRARHATTQPELIAFLRQNPLPRPKSAGFRHPQAERWLKRTKLRFLLSGEDAAVVDGWDLVPHRHLVYVEPEDLQRAVDEILDEGARVADPADANLTIRVRDPWLTEDPKAFAELGQRLLDYLESKNVQFLIQMRDKLPGVEP